MSELGAELYAFFSQHERAGEPRYEREQIEHYLPLIVLTILPELPPEDVSAALLELLRTGLERAGVSPEAAPAEMATGLQRYYERTPPDARLVADLGAFLRQALLTRRSPELSRSARARLGLAPLQVPPRAPGPGVSLLALRAGGMAR